jgi:hypothetical protein
MMTMMLTASHLNDADYDSCNDIWYDDYDDADN